MSYIITDDKHYKDIANSIRSKMQTDREYYPKNMAVTIDNIPSSADGTDNPVIGIYYTNPDDNGNPTKVKISGWVNPAGGFLSVFTSGNVKIFIKQVEFLNCNFVTLADNLFNGCTSLTTINLPDSVKSIGNTAFQSCSSLTTINLPSSLKSIGDNAFNGCTLLTTINLPDGVTSIGISAFNGCSSLTTINLPDGVTSIGNDVFYNCSSLVTINLPDSVTSIGNTTFFRCTSLTTINLPSSLKSIGNAFSTCPSLKYVILDDNFNCNNLNLSTSTRYTRETIVSWLNALADRTGQTAYKLTIGATNLAKLTEEDILIATNKNWTLA